jgi:hypothetical protein
MNKGSIILILVMVAVCLSAGSDAAESGRPPEAVTTVYFKNGSVEIAAEFENHLKEIQAALEADSAIGLQIEGHGHNQADADKNGEILKKRTEAVRQWFVQHGVDTGRLAIKSYGNSTPATRKNIPEDQAITGRVDIFQVSLKRPSVHLPVNRYEFPPVMEGQEVVHDFLVQNKGSAPLEIQRVKTD